MTATSSQDARALWLLPFGVTLVAMFTLQLSNLGFSPLLPSIQADVGMSFTQLGFFTGLYGLLAMLLSVPAGITARRFGEKHVLAALVATHRSKISSETFTDLPVEYEVMARRLCALLRVAVRLNRSRSPRPLPELDVAVGRASLTLVFPAGWLDQHLLTRDDLVGEVERFEVLGLRLDVR